MSLITAGSARSAGVTSSGQVQATILVNNGNIQIGPKVKVSAKLDSIWPNCMTMKNSLAYCHFCYLKIYIKNIFNYIFTHTHTHAHTYHHFLFKGNTEVTVYIALNRNFLLTVGILCNQ